MPSQRRSFDQNRATLRGSLGVSDSVGLSVEFDESECSSMPSVQISKTECARDLLPRLCVKCGVATDAHKVRNFAWYPPVLNLALPLGGLPFIILMRVFTKRMRVILPLCPDHQNHWLKRGLILLPIFIVVAFLASAAFHYAHDTSLPPAAMYAVACTLLAGFVALFFIVRSTTIRPVRITDRAITLAGVHPDFIASLEKEREDDRAAEPVRPQPTRDVQPRAAEQLAPPPLPRRGHDDNRSNDEPRRSDDWNFDDDAPRSRTRRASRSEPVAKQLSVPGVLGLVVGIIGAIVSLFMSPCIGAFSLIGGGLGLLLGVIALVQSKKSQGRIGGGIPVAGTIVSMAALMIAGVWLLLLTFVLDGKPKGDGGGALADANNRPDASARPGPFANNGGRKPENPPVEPRDEEREPKKAPAVAADLAALVNKLRQGDDRADAATEIGKLGVKGLPAVPDLVRALDDDDQEVAEKAAAAIVAIGRQPVAVVLDFTAEWCGPCRQMKPIVAKLLREGLPIVAIELDNHPEVAAKFEVQSVPTYLAVKGDEIVGKQVGTTSERELRKLVAKLGRQPAEANPARPDDPAAQAALLAAVIGLSGDDAWERFQAEAYLRSDAQIVAKLVNLLEGKSPGRIRGGAIQGLLLAVGEKELPESCRQVLARSLANEKEAADVRGYAAIVLGTGRQPAAEITTVLVTAVTKAKSVDLRDRAAKRLGDLRSPTAVPALTAALKDEAEIVRRSAATALGKLGPASLAAVPALLEACAKEDDGPMREALEHICRASDAVPALTKAVGHEDVDVRLTAIVLLTDANDTAPATMALQKALADDDPRVRVRAAVLLQQLGEHDDAILSVLIASLSNQEDTGQADSALMALGRRAVPELVKCITDSSRPAAARLRAAHILTDINPAKNPLTTLTVALGSDDVLIKSSAAIVLARRSPGDEAVVAALLAGLKSTNKEVRHECIRALGEAKAPAAVPPLLAALAGRDEEARNEAAQALARYELDEKAVNQVIGLLAKKATRIPAATVLGTVVKKWPKCVPALINAFVAIKEDDRDSIGATLTSLGKPAIPALLKLVEDGARDESVRADALMVLSQMGATGAEAAPRLIGLLKSPSVALRVNAAIALAHVSSDPAAVPILIEALTDEDDEVQDDVVRALSNLGPKAASAAERLSKLLVAANADDQFVLADALASVTRETDKGMPALLGLLRAEVDDQQHQTGLAAISRVGKLAIPELIKALADERYSQLAVTRVLAAFGSAATEAGPPLARLLAVKDRSVAIAAAIALASIDSKIEAAIAVLIEATESQDAATRSAAINALGHFGKAARPAAQVLIKALKDPTTRDEAAETLSQIGPDAAEAVESLIGILGTRAGPIAADTLAAIGPKAAPAIPALIKLLDREPSMIWAAGALARIGGEARQAVPALIKKLSDDHLRLTALQALGQVAVLDPEPVFGEFQKRVHDADPEVRAVAVRQLGAIKSDKAVPILLKAMDDGEASVREAAVYAIGYGGKAAAPAVAKLVELLQGKDEPLRRAAANALGELGTTAEPAIPALIKTLDDKVIRGSAINALGRIGPKAAPAIPRLIMLLDDSDARYSTIVALGEMGPAAKDALPALRKHMPDAPEHMTLAIKEAMQKIEGKK
jgi:HEAT repeat protein